MRAQFGLAPNTIDAYARSVDSYFSFAVTAGIDQERSTRGHVAQWVRELETRGLANATLIQRITALRLYFDRISDGNSDRIREGTVIGFSRNMHRCQRARDKSRRSAIAKA
jgi:site-specific recombinase XerD